MDSNKTGSARPVHLTSLSQHKVVLRAELASSFYKKRFGLVYAIGATRVHRLCNLKDTSIYIIVPWVSMFKGLKKSLKACL